MDEKIAENKIHGIQEMLNGSGFNPKEFLIGKAENDLNRSFNSVRNFLDFYYSLMDFSLDMKHLEDWYWHFFIKEKFPNKHQYDFTNWIIKNSKEVSCFNDIANTFKHCDRNICNTLVEQVILIPIYDKDTDLSKLENEIKGKGFLFGKKINGVGSQIFCTPMIKTKSGELLYYFDVAKKAFNWWKDFDVGKVFN